MKGEQKMPIQQQEEFFYFVFFVIAVILLVKAAKAIKEKLTNIFEKVWKFFDSVGIIKFRDSKTKKNFLDEDEALNVEENTDIPYPYTQVQLLTPAEYFFFQSVKEMCDANQLLICPKVRIEDFIWADWEKYGLTWKEEQAARNRIKSRHIDFLICDINLNVQCGIELDDSSHANTQKEDAFKDNVFREAGFRNYRIPVRLYNNVSDENSINQVRAYYQEQMKRILNEIVMEHRYCNKQRKSR